MFSHMKSLKTTFHFSHFSQSDTGATSVAADAPPINVPSASGGHVDASCNATVTITCLQQLYNAVGFTLSAKNGNQIGITGYLEQFANIQDLQSFYADDRPDAVNSTFDTVLINGSCDPSETGEVSHRADVYNVVCGFH